MAETPIDIGSRRELFLDNLLIDQLSGQASLRLHNPTRKEIVLTTDQSWEGNMCNMVSVLRDPATQRYRMYYRIGDYFKLANSQVHHQSDIALAESEDGIHWHRRISSSSDNNIILTGQPPFSIGTVGFSPFYDTNPDTPRHEGYKAISSDFARPPTGLYLLTSVDGIDWKLKSGKPFFTQASSQRMRYDSLNVLFWDPAIERYRLYYRDYDENEVRCIRMATSPDLVEWSDAIWLDYGEEAPVTALYTNNVQPYYRAPHLLLGFPARYVERNWSPTIDALPQREHRLFRAQRAAGERCGTSTSDALFMSSRDGEQFTRWDEAFFRPGQRETGNWAYGDNFPANGMIETDGDESGDGRVLSMYTIENYWRQSWIRRHTIRIDGFVSLHAPFAGGQITSKPLTFQGSRLSFNISTSAAGGARVELQDANGTALPGYSLDDCYEIVGDTLNYTVTWKSGPSVEKLVGQPIRVHIQLNDANLYSMQFCD